jgi:hypothetical protein
MPADDIPPPPPSEEIPPPPPEETAAPAAVDGPRRCGKAFSSLLLGFLGCLLGGVALAGMYFNPGASESVQITGNLDTMQEVVVQDATNRGLKMFLASFGQWFGFIGAALGLVGFIQGLTHLYQASEKLVLPKRWLASFGTLFSLIACCSILAALKHGYDAHVGLPKENAEEAFNRVGQLAGIMQQGQDIADGKAPPAKGGLGETATGIAEGILGGSMNPVQQLWTEDYIGRTAPPLDVYAVNTRRSTFELSTLRNTRVLIAFLNPASPACGKVVAPLNALFERTSRGQLWIIGSCPPKSTAALAFTKTYGAKFPIGNAQYYREPYSDITLPPAFMVVDETGRIVSFHFGLASLPAAIRAAEGKP